MANTWVPVARFGAGPLAVGATTTTAGFGWIGRNITEGEVCGVSVTADANGGGAAGAAHAVRIRLYSESVPFGSPGVNLMYDTTIELFHPGTGMSGTDTLAMPIPLFPQLVTDGGTSPSLHTYSVTDIDGNGQNIYNVLFLIRATT